MNSSEKKVVVIDDDTSVRKSLLRLLATEGYEVETFCSAREYLEGEPPPDPVCIVLDMRMPGMNGLELQQVLIARGTGEQIIFVTGHGDIPMCVEAMKCGAVHFLLKPFKSEDLLDAIKQGVERAVSLKERKSLVSRQVSVREQARLLLGSLTPREFEVFRLLIAGLLNKQIAAELQMAEKTVKIHRGRITHKLGISAVADMVRLAQKANVDPGRSR